MASERLGPMQTRVMLRARKASQGHVYCAGYLEERACRRLVQRGLLVPVRKQLDPGWYRRRSFRSMPEIYRLTDRGRSAELSSGDDYPGS